MDHLTLRYYDAEMRYLREAAKEFAQTHPDRAAMLDLDKAGTPDPYVERLFEGFAFSMGRLREKIDDDLPELTEGLVSMLWPHYLRTIPSLSVVAFTPALQTVKMAEVMPAGLEVYSRPVGPKNTVCRYRTTRDVMLNPLNISRVTMATEPDGRSLLRMRFACSTQADWSHADLSHLSLYLGADAPVSSQLNLMLTKRQAALYMRLPGQTDRIRLDGYFSPGGFAEEDGLWPKGDTAFSGYQLLLEYFTFRDKFMFVHLNGLEGITPPAGAEYFDIEVVFSTPWPSELPVTDDAVRLHCVPVTGLYDTWLILGGHQWEDDRLFEREAVSLQITGTNGQLPRRALQSTLLDRCEQVVSTQLSVRNLCKPTLPVYPPAEDRFHWRVLSHLGSGFLNMMSTAEVLRGTLALYNWQEDELNTRRLEAIQQVAHHRLQRFEQGYLLRGLDIEVTLDSNGFTGEGDIHLFGEMLNRFFALYADMNQFNQLTLIVQPEGKCIRWKENHSPRLPG
ncbi:type VI secretion system baseplate subunit TssF [Enterobacter kobei]|nr:type VI secretion system baseplate subunit TssF [Enterobacter kobei]